MTRGHAATRQCWPGHGDMGHSHTAGRNVGECPSEAGNLFSSKLNFCNPNSNYPMTQTLNSERLSQRNKIVCPHENLHLNIHSSFICSGERWDMPRCHPVGEQFSELWYICSTLPGNKNKRTISTQKYLNESSENYRNWEKPAMKHAGAPWQTDGATRSSSWGLPRGNSQCCLDYDPI